MQQPEFQNRRDVPRPSETANLPEEIRRTVTALFNMIRRKKESVAAPHSQLCEHAYRLRPCGLVQKNWRQSPGQTYLQLTYKTDDVTYVIE